MSNSDNGKKDDETSGESVDKASLDLLAEAENRDLDTIWDRHDQMQPQCKFGKQGICCRICSMGPCTIISGKREQGVCGANADTIAARILARMIAGGCAAHSDHGRDIAETLLLATKEDSDYQIKDSQKLEKVASRCGIKLDNKKDNQIAKELAEKALEQFGRRDGDFLFPLGAPETRIKKWKDRGILPRSIDREVVEVMHRTTMGTDTDYKNILKQGIRCALADGWGGSMIATELQDVLFGTPKPLKAKSNLGVLEEDAVNILVHGHEPELSAVVARVSRDPVLNELAREKGADGINLAGICCTANEILMREGIPVAGNFLQQELALTTGAVDLLMVDVQCIMPALADLSSKLHTELVTTSPKAEFPGVKHIPFQRDQAEDIAKKIITLGIENFEHRSDKVHIPEETKDLVGGFTAESVFQFLGGTYRSTYRPLNDAIIDGRLQGAAAIVGCNNPNVRHDFGHTTIAKELIKNDVLVVTTGCAAIGGAKHGLMQPEVAYEMAGEGLREICQAVGVPPVLHMGSCVDNSRVLTLLTNMVEEGGLGEDISDLPVAGAAPEWMAEKAISIGFYVVGSGVFTVFGKPHPITGSDKVTQFVTEGLEEVVGARFAFEEDPKKAAHLMLDNIKKKREKLGLGTKKYAEAN